MLTAKQFGAGNVGNNEGGHVNGSQVQAASVDDLGAQAVAKELGGLPVVADESVPQGSVRVVLAGDYTGPGSGLQDAADTGDGAQPTDDSASTVDAASASGDTAPPPSPIITAASDDPQCVY